MLNRFKKCCSKNTYIYIYICIWDKLLSHPIFIWKLISVVKTPTSGGNLYGSISYSKLLGCALTAPVRTNTVYDKRLLKLRCSSYRLRTAKDMYTIILNELRSDECMMACYQTHKMIFTVRLLYLQFHIIHSRLVCWLCAVIWRQL